MELQLPDSKLSSGSFNFSFCSFSTSSARTQANRLTTTKIPNLLKSLRVFMLIEWKEVLLIFLTHNYLTKCTDCIPRNNDTLDRISGQVLYLWLYLIKCNRGILLPVPCHHRNLD